MDENTGPLEVIQLITCPERRTLGEIHHRPHRFAHRIPSPARLALAAAAAGGVAHVVLGTKLLQALLSQEHEKPHTVVERRIVYSMWFHCASKGGKKTYVRVIGKQRIVFFASHLFCAKSPRIRCDPHRSGERSGDRSAIVVFFLAFGIWRSQDAGHSK